MSESENSGVGDEPPPYMIFVVVFLFFAIGLLGFLVCNLLKKKGYRCRTGDMDFEEEENDKLGENADENEENQDTVEQILKCIIENEANMEAFNEMLKNHNVCVRHDPRSRKESVGGIPTHHHTVHSGTDHNSCHLCAQVRSKKGRRQSRTPRFKQRPGEQTVFSVGRFRVTHHDKKLQGGPNPLVGSGDQIDQSQDSEERKESGYNLRNMFKDVRPPSEGANGVAPSVGKRRKSLTLFGLRRGSDPVGVKAGEGAGRETGGGGVRFAIQQQPVVLEELSQTENIEVAPERGTQPVAEPETKPSKNPQLQAKSEGTGDSLSPQSKIETHEILATEKGSTGGPSPKTAQNAKTKTSFGVSAVSAPSSLPIPLPASPGQAFPTAKNPGNAEDAMTENKELYDPGPLQTSTPIAPLHGNNPGLAPFIPTGQTEHYSSKDFPVIQTPPDPSSSQDSEARIGASLALISLGSSPLSSSKVKTLSSVSSLKTPTSPLSVTSIPNSSVDTPSESMKPDISKVPKTEIKRAGILKSPKTSPVEGGSKALVTSSPTDQLPKDKITNLPLSPSSPMGGRISNVTIVKASPDSRREFSVVTMVEEERDQQRETSNFGVESEKADTSPTVLDVGQPPIQQGGNSRSQDRPTVSQDKDDMVEMEDIKDCKVTQVEEAKTMDE